MPIPVRLQKRTVMLNDSCSQVLTLFSEVLKEHGLSMEKDGSVLSSVNTSSKDPVEGAVNKLKRAFEDVFGVEVGGYSKDLPETKANMDHGANALFTTYHEYWVKLMRGRGKFNAKQLTSDNIEEPYVLIMELHLRLVMQALCLNSELKSDQERQLFIKILSSFSVKLSKKGLLSGVQQEDLFSGHTKWLITLVDTANQIDKMNKATPILAENLTYLKSLEKKIMRHLILVLTKYGTAFLTDDWPGKLADDQLTYTLEEAQAKILSEKAQQLTQIKDSMEDGTSVVAHSTNALDINCIPIALVFYGTLTQDEVVTQKKMIALGGEEKSEIEKLYALLNKSKIMHQFLGKLDSSVISLGWLPFLLGIVALDEFDDAIVQHVKLCEMMFEKVKPKRELFSKPLGVEFGERSHADIISKPSLPKLSALQNPELLETVFSRITLDLEQLTALGAIVNCSVFCNPFVKKPMRDLSQFQSSASQKKLVDQPGTLSRSLNFFNPKAGLVPVGSAPSRRISTNPNSASSPNSSSSYNPFSTTSSTPSLTVSNLSRRDKPRHSSRSTGVSPTSSQDGLQGVGRGRSTSTGSEKLSRKFSTHPSENSSTNPFDGVSVKRNDGVLVVNSVELDDYPLLRNVDDGIDGESFTAYPDREERTTGNTKKSSPDYTSTSQMVELEKLPSTKTTSGKFSSNVYSTPKKRKNPKFTTAYIETFVKTIGGLTANELREAAQLSNQATYFSLPGVSDFCRRAREITRNFVPKLAHEKPPFMIDDILAYRRDEVAVLQYFCVEAAQLGDDSRLMNFISTMIDMTDESFLWADYNNLKNHFRALLASQRRGEVIAACKLKNNSDFFREKLVLMNENHTLRVERDELSKKNRSLEEEKRQLQNENAGLRPENFALTRNLALQVDILNQKMELQNKEQLVSEVNSLKQQMELQSKEIEKLKNRDQSVNGKAHCTLF